MRQYLVKSLVNNLVTPNGVTNKLHTNNDKSFTPNWQNVSPLYVNNFPWYTSGLKQETQLKLCASSDTLFIQIIAKDKHSYGKQTQLNHMLICEDSCVEFFFSPSGILGSSYINLEVNCCGTIHLAYGPSRNERKFITPELAEKIRCTSSINAPVKVESEHDESWSIEVALPFYVVEQLTEQQINKEKWFGNFYRCGGRVEPQYSVWSNINASSPNFHIPECFGEIIFTR